MTTGIQGSCSYSAEEENASSLGGRGKADVEAKPAKKLEEAGESSPGQIPDTCVQKIYLDFLELARTDYLN